MSQLSSIVSEKGYYYDIFENWEAKIYFFFPNSWREQCRKIYIVYYALLQSSLQWKSNAFIFLYRTNIKIVEMIFHSEN